MADQEDKQTLDPEAQAAAAEAAPEAPAESPAEETAPEAPDLEGAEAEPGVPAARLAELEAEAADLKDKLLRAMAETENVRRRAQREREEASKYAITNFAREMVGVADNLRRALDHVPAETRAQDEVVESLAAGVEMTERAMLSAFERFGIRPVEALGKPFDHNLHEAMFEVPDPSQPSGTVVQELEKGYVLEDRLLRPARVGVAKGGPRPVNGEGGTAADTADGKAAAKGQRATYEKTSDGQGDADPKGGHIDEKT